MNRPAQPHFFPAGDDLPLFTGQPVTVMQATSRPLPEPYTQIELTLYRTTDSRPFYARYNELSGNLTGESSELPAGTLVRLVHPSWQVANKCLVATADDLYTWTWLDRLSLA